jgi:hypothetical protein
MLKLLILLAIAVVTASATPDFDAYCARHGKQYASGDEYEMRRTLYTKEAERVAAHNADASKTWKEALNNFADWTVDEFAVTKGCWCCASFLLVTSFMFVFSALYAHKF